MYVQKGPGSGTCSLQTGAAFCAPLFLVLRQQPRCTHLCPAGGSRLCAGDVAVAAAATPASAGASPAAAAAAVDPAAGLDLVQQLLGRKKKFKELAEHVTKAVAKKGKVGVREGCIPCNGKCQLQTRMSSLAMSVMF